MSYAYKCDCFGNRYLCCISDGCYYFPIGYTCSFSMTLSSTPTCTCYPSRYVCCYDKGCYYKEPYNCTGSNSITISKTIGSPTCLCYPNKLVCNNQDMWFRIVDTTNCYAPSPTASRACSCYPGKYEICCNEATCSYFTSCSSIDIVPETITQTITVTSMDTTTVTTTSFVSSSTSSDINVTAIVLGVIIPIMAIILAIILIWFYFKRKHIFQKREENILFMVADDGRLKKENIKQNEQGNENLINLKFGEDPISNPSLYKREAEVDYKNEIKEESKAEVDYKNEIKEESKDKEEEIADDILAVKREKERAQTNKMCMEENEDVQKGIGFKSNITSSTRK